MIANNHLNLHFYNFDRPTKFRLENAHHTVKLEPLGAAYEFAFRAQNSSGAATASDVLATADEYVDPVWRASNANERRQFAPAPAVAPPPHSSDNISDKRILPESARARLSSSSSSPPLKQTPSGAHSRRNQLADAPSAGAAANDDADDDERHSLPYEGAPTIKLDWLDDGNNEYKLRDVHFHWAERRDNGSEHAIDGRRAAMEVSGLQVHCGICPRQVRAQPAPPIRVSPISLRFRPQRLTGCAAHRCTWCTSNTDSTSRRLASLRTRSQ